MTPIMLGKRLVNSIADVVRDHKHISIPNHMNIHRVEHSVPGETVTRIRGAGPCRRVRPAQSQPRRLRPIDGAQNFASNGGHLWNC